MSLPDDFTEDFHQLVSFQRNPVGTLGDDTSFQPNPSKNSNFQNVQLPHSYSKRAFDTSEMDILMDFFAVVHSSTNCAVNATYSCYTMITIGGKIFGSYTEESIKKL